MKKGLTISLAVLMVLGLATVVLAGSTWYVEKHTSGYTYEEEIINCGDTQIYEELENWGTLDFFKEVMTGDGGTFELKQFSATGTTDFGDQTVSGLCKQFETIHNDGSFLFSKDFTASPGGTPGGMVVDEFKVIDANGFTFFSEIAVIGGQNWQDEDDDLSNGIQWKHEEPYDISTAYIEESVENEGSIQIYKVKESKGDWHLFESKEISGSGITGITKDIGYWNNTRVNRPEDSTWMDVQIVFNSESEYYYDYQASESDLVAGPYEFCTFGWNVGEINTYHSNIGTDEAFDYFEWVEVNPAEHHREGS